MSTFYCFILKLPEYVFGRMFVMEVKRTGLGKDMDLDMGRCGKIWTAITVEKKAV